MPPYKNEYKNYINLTEAFKPDLTRLYVSAISVSFEVYELSLSLCLHFTPPSLITCKKIRKCPDLCEATASN